MDATNQKAIDRKARMQLSPVPATYRPAEIRIHDFEEALILHTPAAARAEAARCLHCPTAPCQAACPLHNDIGGALALLEAGDINGAAQLYRETNPQPEACGRLCPQSFCQDACTLNKVGKPIDTRHLEAFVTTYQRRTTGVPLPEIAPATGKKVAVVGSGPAGLAVAEYLARKGHQVVVYERHSHPGGLLVYGIPKFKLSLESVEAKVHWLKELGVHFECGVTIGKDISMAQLWEEYNALFLGIGSQEHTLPGIPGETLEGIHKATEFLCRGNLPAAMLPPEWREPLTVGARVHVLGGGNTAIDCLRTALRLPGVQEAICYYRRSKAEMPAGEDEYQHAIEEGAAFEWQVCPTAFVGDAEGKICAVVYQRMSLCEPDESGRCRPVPISGSEFTVEADTVILALGYRLDHTLASQVPGLALNSRGMIAVTDRSTGETSVPGLFAAGDVVRGADLLSPAMADALSVAAAMDAYLQREA